MIFRWVEGWAPVAAYVLMASFVSAGQPADLTDARKVAEAVEARNTGDKIVASVVMTIADSSSRKRVRKLTQKSLDFPGGTKTRMVFREPADVRGTGLLSIDYEEGGRDDDQWLFLPSLKKATRVAASNSAESFLGSDLSFADMTQVDTSLYEYRMIAQEEAVEGEPCWHIEARAKTARERERTGYLKSEAWVSKKTLMPIRSKSWIGDGRKLKYISLGDIRNVTGIWTAHRLTVKVVQNGSVESWTTLEMENVRYGSPEISDDVFTVPALESAGF